MKKFIAVLLSALIILTLFACGNKSDTPNDSAAPDFPQDSSNTSTDSGQNPTSSTSEDKYGGMMKVVCTAEGASTIGLPWEVFGVDIALLIPGCETLFIEKVDGTLEPFLAERYEIDNDALTIKITLRQGIKFHDGSDFNADTCAWNLERELEGLTLSTAIENIEKTGDYEVTIKLNRYQNNILSGLASHTNSMISKEAYDKNGADWARENPIGTGPFKISEYVQGSHITYVRNDDYWRDDEPYLDSIEFQFIRDVMTQNVAMESSGDQSIDVLNTTNGEQIAMLREMGYNVTSTPIGPISLVPSSLDKNSPFAKIEVRQAISYALDRDSIVNARGFGVLTPAEQFIADLWPQSHLDDSYNLSYDLDKAKELMASAGYADGFTTTLYAQPGLADKDACVAIQSQLAQIGITCTVEYPDSGGYSALRSNGWDGLLVQHTRTLTNNAATFNFYFGNTSKLLSQLWWPDEMEDLIQASMSKDDNSAELQACHKLVLDNMLVIPVYNLYDSWISKPYVADAEFGLWSSSTMFLPYQAYFTEK